MNYEELQSKVVEAIEKKDESLSFAQDDSYGFEQSLGIDKRLIGNSIGGAFAGTVSGIISGVLPINVGIAGVPALIAGVLMKKTIAKGGMLKDVSDGVIIAGLSETVSSLIGGSIMGLGQERKEMAVEESSNRIEGVVY